MTSIEALLALLNTANTKTYTASQVTFGNPSNIVEAEEGQPNTHITVTGVEAQGYTGSKELSYIRLDLTKQFEGHPLESFGPAEGGTLAEVLADIKTQTGVEILAEDLSNPADVDFTQASVTLTASATSVKWIGSVVVTTRTDLKDLATDITVATLPGFEYQVIA